MKPNQNLVIAQVVNHLNANGYLAWRQENNGRIDENELVLRISKLLVALAHVNYSLDRVAQLVKDIVRKCYRPVPSSRKGIPDVIGFHLETAKWIVVEVKIGNDRLRPDQEEFIKILKRSGGDCWIIREINSFKIAFARKHQILQAA